MNDLERRMSELYGRPLTDPEKIVIMRVAKALGLRSDDALLGIVGALQFYLQLFDVIPKKISEITTEVLDKARETSEAQTRASAKRVEEQLTITAVNIARSTAKNVSMRELLRSLAFCSSVITLLLCLAGAYCFRWGVESGRNNIMAEIQQAKLLNEWVGTSDAQEAHRLAVVTDVSRFSRCTGKGWKKKDGWCYPVADSDNRVHGWRMPQ